MQDAAILVDGGVDKRAARPAILRLNMKYVLANADVRVESGTDSDGVPPCLRARGKFLVRRD